MESELLVLEKKANYFMDNEITVHVVLKKGKQEGGFLNGTINKVSKDFFILIDRVKGAIPVFFLEVYKIEPYEKK